MQSMNFNTVGVRIDGIRSGDPQLVVCAYEISKSDEYTNHVIFSIREYTALYTEIARSNGIYDKFQEISR